MDGELFDPTTGLPLGNHMQVMPPLTTVAGGVGSVDQWVMDETKKLDAQQKIQQQKLLDLQQVSECGCGCVDGCRWVGECVVCVGVGVGVGGCRCVDGCGWVGECVVCAGVGVWMDGCGWVSECVVCACGGGGGGGGAGVCMHACMSIYVCMHVSMCM